MLPQESALWGTNRPDALRVGHERLRERILMYNSQGTSTVRRIRSPKASKGNTPRHDTEVNEPFSICTRSPPSGTVPSQDTTHHRHPANGLLSPPN